MENAIIKALQLKNIAVVGLSRDPNKAAHSVPLYLQHQGYRVFPVNPFGGAELLGEKVYNKVSEINEKIDLVLIFRPSSEVPTVVEDALSRGDIQGIWLQEGITNADAEKLAFDHQLLFVQDKCSFKEHRRLN